MPLICPVQVFRSSVVILIASVSLWHCAAEKSPTGGPPDIEGPVVVRVEPASGEADLEPGDDIFITFSELVDPVSVPGSVVFTPEITFTVRVRGRRVRLRPVEPLQDSTTYVLTLQRGIRDYQRNSIPQSYQLVFSTGGEIPEGRMEGRIAESDPKKPVEIGLFQKVAGTDSFALTQSINLGSEGSFSFNYLIPGSYRIVAMEGNLSDFPAGLHRRAYALPTVDPINLVSDPVTLALRRSPALSQPQIQSVEWQTTSYLTVTFDTPFGEAPIPPGLYATQNPTVYGHILSLTEDDTITIDLGAGYTQLGEAYRIEPLVVPRPELTDTIPPILTLPGNRISLIPHTEGDARPDSEFVLPGESARGRITFSEPIKITSGLTVQLTGRDTLDVPLQMINPLTLEIKVPEPERVNQATFLGWAISDASGNTMTDSLINLTMVYTRSQTTGRIRGVILQSPGRVVVEARDIESRERIAYTVTDSAAYLLDQLPPGFYVIFAHEQIGDDPVPYYSGRWYPYSRAARFQYYPEIVEVRPRWEVDGIDINFNAALLSIPFRDRSMSNE